MIKNIFWRSLFFEIFVTKYCVEFSLIIIGTAKQDCVIKVRDI